MLFIIWVVGYICLVSVGVISEWFVWITSSSAVVKEEVEVRVE